MYKIIGIDEAGKGPLIGSLFVGFSIKELEKKEDLEKFQKELKEMGVKDSKLIPLDKIDQLYEKLQNIIRAKFVQLTPTLIDSHNKKGGKLNELEIQGIIQILETEKPNLVIIDALTANPNRFKNEIAQRLTFKCEIIAENKADTNFPLVGAASIIAKGLREKEIAQIKQNIKIDCGSGYCHDPTTIEFLKQHYNNKEFDFIFRKSWQTYKNIITEKLEKSLMDF